MDNRRIKIAMKILDEVDAQFPETNEFIDERIEQECSKENILVEELYVYKQKVNIFYSAVLGFQAETFSLHLTKYVKGYSMKLNSLGHDIYLHVI